MYRTAATYYPNHWDKWDRIWVRSLRSRGSLYRGHGMIGSQPFLRYPHNSGDGLKFNNRHGPLKGFNLRSQIWYLLVHWFRVCYGFCHHILYFWHFCIGSFTTPMFYKCPPAFIDTFPYYIRALFSTDKRLGFEAWHCEELFLTTKSQKQFSPVILWLGFYKCSWYLWFWIHMHCCCQSLFSSFRSTPPVIFIKVFFPEFCSFLGWPLLLLGPYQGRVGEAWLAAMSKFLGPSYLIMSYYTVG